MQHLRIKVSKAFFNRYKFSKLSPIRITPLEGYHYKHHFVVVDANPKDCTFYGVAGSAGEREIYGKILISYDGDYEETAEVVTN